MQVGKVEQSASSQSTKVSRSLSMPSWQSSGATMQAGSAAQSVSAQSVKRSKSLSTPSVQISRARAGQAPAERVSA